MKFLLALGKCKKVIGQKVSDVKCALKFFEAVAVLKMKIRKATREKPEEKSKSFGQHVFDFHSAFFLVAFVLFNWAATGSQKFWSHFYRMPLCDS